MEFLAILLSLLSLLIAIMQIVFVTRSIKSKSYLQYRKQLEEFERTRKRIVEGLDDDRKKFE